MTVTTVLLPYADAELFTNYLTSKAIVYDLYFLQYKGSNTLTLGTCNLQYKCTQ